MNQPLDKRLIREGGIAGAVNQPLDKRLIREGGIAGAVNQPLDERLIREGGIAGAVNQPPDQPAGAARPPRLFAGKEAPIPGSLRPARPVPAHVIG